MSRLTFTTRERALLVHLTRRQLDHDRAWLAELDAMGANAASVAAAVATVDDVATLVAKLEASTPEA